MWIVHRCVLVFIISRFIVFVQCSLICFSSSCSSMFFNNMQLPRHIRNKQQCNWCEYTAIIFMSMTFLLFFNFKYQMAPNKYGNLPIANSKIKFIFISDAEKINKWKSVNFTFSCTLSHYTRVLYCTSVDFHQTKRFNCWPLSGIHMRLVCIFTIIIAIKI